MANPVEKQVRAIAAAAIAEAGLTNDTPLREVNAVLRTLQDKIETQFAPDPSASLIALRGALGEIAVEQGLLLPRLRVGRLPTGPEPLRGVTWTRNARAAFAMEAALDRALENRKRAGGPELPVLILASAILKGLLLRPEAWVALLNRLRDGTLVLHEGNALPQLPYITLTLPGQTGRPVHGAARGEEYRFFPDVQTLALVRRWQKAKPRSVAARAPQEALDLLVKVLRPEGLPKSLKPADFAAAACAPFEDRAQVALPYALTAVASGELVALCLDETAWSCLLDPGRAQTHVAETTMERRPRKPALAGAVDPGILWQALQVDSDRVKPRAGKVREALRGLEDTALAPAAEALRLWYLSLLARERKVSTLQTYHVAIAGPVLSLLGSEDPREWSADELEDLAYLAARGGTANREAYRLGRLAQFLAFAARDRRLGWATVSGLEGGVGVDEIVRSAHLGPARARAVLVGFGQVLPRPEATACQVAFLLAWRGGLRLAEIAGLTLADVLDGPMGTLCVRSHAGTRLKSAAGRRLVPMRAMLADRAELDIFDGFVARRWREASSGRDPFLAERFDKVRFRALLAELGGIWPHGLRHAALSNLFLVLFGPEAAAVEIERVTGWSAPGQARLRALFLGEQPDPRRAAPQLARLAGHAEPATTFRHYLHLNDLTLGLIVRAGAESLSPGQVRRRLGLNVRTCPDGPEAVRPEAFRSKVLTGLVRERLKGLVPEFAPAWPTVTPLTPNLALRLLSQLEAGQAAYDLAADHGLARARIDALADAAQEVLSRRTGRGRALVAARAGALAPPVPRRKAEQEAALTIAARVLAGPEPRPWAERVLAQSHPTRAGLRLRRPEDARALLAPLTGVVGVLRFALPTGQVGVEARWRDALGATITLAPDPAARAAPQGPWGRAILDLWHAESGPRRTALPALRFAAFLVLVLVGAG